ncbi:MAG TPA: sugar phosphate isomerase/epimerase [Flavitalea sp.]|nr:sugar phosphate isomerase/epimerase [Flavitalea sp.]
MKRRKFLQHTTRAGVGILIPLKQLAPFQKPIMDKVNLKILATNWGFAGTLDQFCQKVKQEGYDGIEIWWPTEKKSQDELFAALQKHQLDVGFLCGSGEMNYEKHLEQFKKMVTGAATEFGKKPLYINCHSGRDHFTFEQNTEFIRHTIKLAKDTGLKICHETHRSRILFAAHVARQFLIQNPDLRITLDISHWCNVHESLLQDQQENVNLALQRTDHIHARIGHPEGPQVNDPRAPEWNDSVQAHFAWWDKVVEFKKAANQTLTILTEFGPPDYMPTLPYTRQPVANQWAINVHMMQVLRKRYSS